jgi:hypothetical protein
MSGQRYHLALDDDQVHDLMSCGDENVVLDWVDKALESDRLDSNRIHGGYKEWDIVLGCLTHGDYDPKGGTYPLNRCFFGGRLLVAEGSIVNLVMPGEVADVAEALGRVDEADFRRRYQGALPAFPNNFRPIAMKYLAEFYEKLLGLRDFYRLAAREGRAVLSYTDDPLDGFFKM